MEKLSILLHHVNERGILFMGFFSFRLLPRGFFSFQLLTTISLRPTSRLVSDGNHNDNQPIHSGPTTYAMSIVYRLRIAIL
jgi:hypothetical protein